MLKKIEMKFNAKMEKISGHVGRVEGRVNQQVHETRKVIEDLSNLDRVSNLKY